MKINATAVVFWGASFLTGYLFYDTRTGLFALLASLVISLLCA